MFWAILVTALIVLFFCVKWNFVDFVRSKLHIKVKTLIKFIPLLFLVLLVAVSASATEQVFVGVAHTNGNNGSVWRSNLYVLPMSCHKPPWEGGNGCIVSYTLTGIGKDGETNTVSGYVDAVVGEPIPVEDIFGFIAMMDSSGVLLVDSPDDLSFSYVYTYNATADGGKFGQTILSAFPLSVGATYTAVYPEGRAAIWVYNAGEHPGIFKYNRAYEVVSPGVTYIPIPPPSSAIQFCAGCLPPFGGGFDPDMPLYVTVTSVDNTTNDGTTAPLFMTTPPPPSENE